MKEYPQQVIHVHARTHIYFMYCMKCYVGEMEIEIVIVYIAHVLDIWYVPDWEVFS